MANWTRRGFLGSLAGVATSLAAQQSANQSLPEKRTGHGSIKITDDGADAILYLSHQSDL
jgi:hypothetical protein